MSEEEKKALYKEIMDSIAPIIKNALITERYTEEDRIDDARKQAFVRQRAEEAVSAAGFNVHGDKNNDFFFKVNVKDFSDKALIYKKIFDALRPDPDELRVAAEQSIFGNICCKVYLPAFNHCHF